MIKAISYWSMKDGFGRHPIEDALATAKKHGFQGLELTINADPKHELNVGSTQAQCTKIRKMIDKSGIAVQTLASGMSWGFNPTSEDPKVRKKAIELHAAALQRAGWLGIQSVLFVPGVVKSPISPDIIRYDKAVDRAREACKQLLDVAEKAKVELCVENVWNGLFYSPLEFAAFVDSFKHPNMGVYFDVGNVLGLHQHPPHWIELLGKRIKRIHIKDFKQGIGNLTGFCDLGAGDVPWAEVMKALRGIGYNKTLVAEMMPWDLAVLPRTSAALDAIMAL